MTTLNAERSAVDGRAQALLWATAGAAWVANAVLGLDAAEGSSGFYATEAVWIAVHLLVLLGLTIMWRAEIVGGSRWGRRGLALAIAGRSWFIACELAAIAIGHDELPIFPGAVISTALGMTTAGAAAALAGPWRGWRAAGLIAMGAYPLLVIVPTYAVTGERPPNALVAGWGLTFFAIAAAWARSPAHQTLAIPHPPTPRADGAAA